VSGDYPNDGKAIGIAISGKMLKKENWGSSDAFIAPVEYTIEDGFIEEKIYDESELEYDLMDVKDRRLYLGAKVFVGQNNYLRIEFNVNPPPKCPCGK
jgi:hypothetical protein